LKDVKARVLSQFTLFSGLDHRARQGIASHVHERVFGPGQVIVIANEPCQAVYLIVQGEVRAYRLSLEGREYVLEDLGPGQTFNLSPALDGGVNLATVEALTETTIYVIARDPFRQIVRDHQEMALTILEHMAGQVRSLCDTVEDLALHTVRTRLARCLLSSLNGGVRSARHWTQEDLAMHIGTVRDVVGRTLRAFSKEGLIHRQRGRLAIADLAGLRREAMCEP
jgi:CRP/FNR family transcriptional regulator